jgi:hypothetical protein
VDSVKKVAAFPHQDRVFALRYEDLTASPEETARAVCAFLDISFSAEMLEINERAKSAMAEEAEKQYHASGHTSITADKTGKGRNAIPREELEKLAPIMDPWLIKLGYRRCLDE